MTPRFFLGEHRLCLRPRGQGFQTLLEHQLSVLPEPEQRRELVAASGDEIQRLRFLGSTDELIFEARSLVETRPAPPLESCFNGLEPPLPYPRGQLNSDLQGALEGWLPNGQHEPCGHRPHPGSPDGQQPADPGLSEATD